MTRRGLQTGFFATRTDLWPGLERIEANQSLKFVPYLDPGPAPPEYRSLRAEASDLGTARSGDHNTGHCYIVVDAGVPVAVRSVQRGGRVYHGIDTERLSGAILLRTGGIYGERVLIAGDVSTVGEGADTRALQRSFTRDLTRGFEDLKGWRVGPEAGRLLDAGWRLVTLSVRSPAEYDLRRT